MGSSAAADFVDEEWVKPNTVTDGNHAVTIEETVSNTPDYSSLSATQGEYEFRNRKLCTSTSDIHCTDGKPASDINWHFLSILPPCSANVLADCVSGIKATSTSGVISSASFKALVDDNQVNIFPPDPKFQIPVSSAPSLWTINTPESSDQITYMVRAIWSGTYNAKTKKTESKLSTSLFPVVLKTRFIGPNPCGNGVITVNCHNGRYLEVTVQDSKGKYLYADGANAITGLNCVYVLPNKGEFEQCYVLQPFPNDISYSLDLRLKREPIGWFLGRMQKTSILMNKSAEIVNLEVRAQPVRVPAFYFEDSWAKLTAAQQNWWKMCLKSGGDDRTCGSWSRTGWDKVQKIPRDDNEINIGHSSESSEDNNYGINGFDVLNFWSSANGDKANASPGVWNFRTLSENQMMAPIQRGDLSEKSASCFTKFNGLIGVVSTNSTVYSGGPPGFKDSTMNYKVASPHLDRNGLVNQGSYDLVIRSDVARCLYGFSAAPVQASVSIIGETGELKVATTVIGEKNGWLSMGAYGFTYSSPTIKVKLVQDAPTTIATPSASTKPVVKTISITCFKGKTSKKVTAINPKCPVGYKKK